MDINIVIGSFAIISGIVTSVVRQLAPHKFAKLGVMKEKFGDKLGYAIHFFAYTLVPLAFGLVTLNNSF